MLGCNKLKKLNNLPDDVFIIIYKIIFAEDSLKKVRERGDQILSMCNGIFFKRGYNLFLPRFGYQAWLPSLVTKLGSQGWF